MSTDALFPPALRFLKIQRVLIAREVQAGRHLGTLISTPQLWRGTLDSVVYEVVLDGGHEVAVCPIISLEDLERLLPTLRDRLRAISVRRAALAMSGQESIPMPS